MKQLSILRGVGIMIIISILGAWTNHDKVQCIVDATIVEIIPTGTNYQATSCPGAKVRYRPEKMASQGFSDSDETDENGEVHFLVIESAGTKVRYQAFKPGFIPGAPTSEYIDKGQVCLELNVMRKTEVKKIENRIRNFLNDKSLRNAEQMLNEFEKFFPDFREIEDFKGLKDLEIDLKERQKSSSTLNPGSLENLEQMLRAREQERIRTGNPDLKRSGNGL